MRTTYTVTLLLLGTLALPTVAQTPLGNAFAEMKSRDPATAKRAKDGLAVLTVQELPTIEKDTGTLCNALSDPDSYIRLQATAILLTIVVAAPSHNQVVLACTSGLIATATDPADRVRNNALFALAMNPAGPPPQAQEVFVKALNSTSFRTAEVGAAGLLKENGGNNQANHKMVEEALNAAPDAQHRLNILYAIGGSGVPSETLFEDSQKFLSDPDPNVQQAAIDAVAATGTDKARIATVMQNLVGSSSVSQQSRRHAQAVLNQIQPAQ